MSEKQASDETGTHSVWRLLGLLRPYIWPLLAGTMLMFVVTAIGLVTTHQLGRVLDATVLANSLDRLNTTLLILLGLAALSAILNYFQGLLLGFTSIRMLADLRQKLFNHLVHLGPDFYDSKPVGDLLSRLGSDLTIMQGALTGAIPAGLRALLQFAGAFITLFLIDTRLTLVALAVIPPVALTSHFLGRWLRTLNQKQQDALAETSSLAEEAFSGIRTVHWFGQEGHEANRYGGALGRLQSLQVKGAKIGSAVESISAFAGTLALLLVLRYGGNLILRGEMSPGELVSFLLYTGTIALSVSTLGRLFTGYQALAGASVRVFEYLDRKPIVLEPSQAVEIGRPKGHLQFQNVEFGYPSSNGKMALRSIDINVKPGEIVALVGPSGGGKSTLFSLLFRFYDPGSGSVKIDGIQLPSMRVKDLRSSIGIVPQDISLFTGTVEENIRYGNLEATVEEVKAAAQAADAHEFIEKLPNGYQETIGSRGMKLSGGQRQRIAIARAFLKNPAIMLLDEATSALDPDSEERLRKALTALLKGRTTLVIAHRLATARLAHRILVMEEGTITASGTHEELFATNDVYARFWRLQTSGTREERLEEKDETLFGPATVVGELNVKAGPTSKAMN